MRTWPYRFQRLRLAFEQPRWHRFYRNERIADGAHAANPRGSQQRHQNLGKDVGVFVRIEVSDLETGGLNLPYLRSDFRDQLIAIEASQHGARGEGRKAGVELARLCRANRQQRIHRVRWRHRRSVHQYDVASHGEIRRRARRSHRVLERRAIGHQCRRRYDSTGVGFHNGSIHSCGQTKIIGVDD